MGVVKKGEANPQIIEENPPVVKEETPPAGTESQQSTETPPVEVEEKTTYTTEEYESMLAAARKDAASHRTKNKATEKTLKARDDELAKFQQVEKDKELADKSDLEKAAIRIGELEGENTGLKTDVLSMTNNNIELQITSQVDAQMAAQGRQFRSNFERNGFLQGLTAKNVEGKYKTTEEVQADVSAFMDTTFEGPPAVPKNPKVEQTDDAAQIMNSIRTLMAIKQGSMTSEQVQELKDLQAKYQVLAKASVAEGNRATQTPKTIFPKGI